MEHSDALRIVIVGHVDHGKSTLIGRLFYDTGSLPEERYREIERTCREQGRPFEFAYLMDALEEERDQNITIDTAQTFFKTAKRPYIIIDAPGYKEFLKNMVTGAAAADAAILLVDGAEGVREQTRRHAYILSLLGLRQVAVAVNKLDLVAFGRGRFHEVEEEIRGFLGSVDIVPSYVVPISARDGDNIAKPSSRMPWYDGPTLLAALDSFAPSRGASGLPLRFPVQDVYRWDDKRLYAGRLESGELRPGDRVVFAPSGKASRVRSVETWGNDELAAASAGMCVGITLADELFVERGEVMGRDDDPPRGAREIAASLFWLGNEPLRLNRKYVLKLATSETEVTLSAITERLNSSTLEIIERHADRVENLEVANVTFVPARPVAADTFEENPRLGRFVVSVEGFVAGGGIVREVRTDDVGARARVIRLNTRIMTEPDGNFVDLSREAGPVEFTVSPGFVDRLGKGERVAVRLRTADQAEKLARLAFGHDLAFEFRRDGEGARIVLFRDPVRRPGASADAGPEI
ncbi:MAG: sulfate adenylyltransferase subunit 1 [Deltaproteobacteria bacterium]